MKRLARNIAVARTVSRRQLLSRARKLARRVLHPVRVPLLGGPHRLKGVDALLTTEAARQVEVAGGVLAHVRSRQRPRWFPGPDVARAEPASFPDEAAESLATAERVLVGEYRFLNVRALRSGNPPDWLRGPRGCKEWTYLLNRFHYLLDVARAYRYTQREEFVRVGMELVDDWIRRNPEGHPTTWESVSCAWRIENWLAALLHFLPSDCLTEGWTSQLLASVAHHAEYLRRHIEYDLAGNHLLFEAKGLIVAGLMLPEMRRAAVWLREGMELLRREVARQVLPDGGHAELATHYHVEITLLLTELAVLLELNGARVPWALVGALRRMYRFLLWITRPDGDIPMLGDSVRDDPIVARRLLGLGFAYLGDEELGVLARGGAQVDRLLGPGCSERIEGSEARAPSEKSRVFASSGYAVARTGWTKASDYLIWDCGAFGMRAGPGHGHADQLSLELVAGGVTVLLDPGVYQYEPGRWRDYFRGVTAHNTLRLGGRNPCSMWSAYRVLHPPRTRLLGWVGLPGLHVGEAEHDGYRRDTGLIHRRVVLWLDGQVWVIADWLHPLVGDVPWEVFFHFAPDAELSIEDWRFRAVVPGAGSVEGRLFGAQDSCRVVRGQLDPIQGWVSHGFGQKQEAPVLVVSGGLAASPLVTVLGRGSEADRWSLEDAGEGAVVLKGGTDRNGTTIGLRGPRSPRLRHGILDTDGRTIVCERRDGMLSRVVLIGGRYLNWNGSPLLQAGRIADFVQRSNDGAAGVLGASAGVDVRIGGGGIPGARPACAEAGQVRAFRLVDDGRSARPEPEG